jgi:hypothetical protein
MDIIRSLPQKILKALVEVHFSVALIIGYALSCWIWNIAEQGSKALRVAIVSDSEDPAVFGLKEVSDPGFHDIAFNAKSRPAPGLMISRFFRSRSVEGWEYLLFPPSTTRSTVSAISRETSDALDGGGEPVRFALVDVNGPAKSMIL